MTRLYFLILAISLGNASAEWARLIDSTVVKVRGKKGDQVAILRSDGSKGIISKDKVTGYLSPLVANRIVNEVMAKIGRPEHHDEVRKKLRQIGMAAVPRLLTHLQGRNLDERRAAMAALQMAWGAEAKPTIKGLLNDSDPYITRLALRLVMRHFEADERLPLLAPFANVNLPPDEAGPAIAALLGNEPNAQRMQEAVGKPAFWPHVHHLLPRYHGEAFRESTRRMLVEGDIDAQRSALVASIYQMNHSYGIRKLAIERLAHANADLREIAAEYLRWHGAEQDVAALQTQANAELQDLEQDAYRQIDNGHIN